MKRICSYLIFFAAFLCFAALQPSIASADSRIGFLVSSCELVNGSVIIDGKFNNVTDRDAAVWGIDEDITFADSASGEIIHVDSASFDLDLDVPAHSAVEHRLVINNVDARKYPYRYKYNITKLVHYALN